MIADLTSGINKKTNFIDLKQDLKLIRKYSIKI